MIETRDIKAYATKVFRLSRGYSDRRIMHSEREWLLIVCTFFILFLSSVVFSVWQYQLYKDLPYNIITADDKHLPQYNRELADQLVKNFDASLDKYKSLVTFEVGIGDTTRDDPELEFDTATSSEVIDEALHAPDTDEGEEVDNNIDSEGDEVARDNVFDIGDIQVIE